MFGSPAKPNACISQRVCILPANPVSAIVLAGGQSSRMGQDKALLSIQGLPLLQKIYQVAQPLATEVYVVTPWPDRYQTILSGKVQWVLDRHSQGPLVAFAQGLAEVKTDWVVLLACDLPHLSTELWQTALPLMAALTPEMALLPRDPKGWQPLCGFYHRACLPSLQKAIDQGERSFQRWLGSLEVQELPVADPNLLFNCNTPEDLQELSS